MYRQNQLVMVIYNHMLPLQLFMKKNSILQSSKKWEENSRNSKLLKQCETYKGVEQKKLYLVRLNIPLAQFLVPGND